MLCSDRLFYLRIVNTCGKRGGSWPLVLTVMTPAVQWDEALDATPTWRGVLVGQGGAGVELPQPLLDVDRGEFDDVGGRALHRGVHRLPLGLGGGVGGGGR